MTPHLFFEQIGLAMPETTFVSAAGVLALLWVVMRGFCESVGREVGKQTHTNP